MASTHAESVEENSEETKAAAAALVDDFHNAYAAELMEKHEVWFKGFLMKSTRVFKHTCGLVGQDYQQETLPW